MVQLGRHERKQSIMRFPPKLQILFQVSYISVNVNELSILKIDRQREKEYLDGFPSYHKIKGTSENMRVVSTSSDLRSALLHVSVHLANRANTQQ